MRILVYTCLLLATSVWATEQIGQTYSIAEGDMLKDIEKAVEQTDWQKVLTKDQDSWGHFRVFLFPQLKKITSDALSLGTQPSLKFEIRETALSFIQRALLLTLCSMSRCLGE